MSYGLALWLSGFAGGSALMALASGEPGTFWPGIVLVVACVGWLLIALLLRLGRESESA